MINVPSKPSTILVSIETTPTSLKQIDRVCPGIDIRIGPHLNQVGQTMDPALMRGVDVLLCELPPDNFDDFDQLKWIQLTSAGYNQVVNLPLMEQGIRVTNGLGNFDSPIAEWNVMMMLMWQREMLEQLANQKNIIWNPIGRYQRDLFGATIGFWGYGGIARETARLAKALHMNVWAMTRTGQTSKREGIYCVKGTGDPQGILPDQVFSPSQQSEFLQGIDYLFVTMPLTPKTEGIIGEQELRQLKSSAVLINPSRAAIIQEQAFIRSLKERWIRGASVDVHYAYPLPPEHPMWMLDNLIMTPHISGSCESPQFIKRIYDIFCRNLTSYLNDQPMLNELTTAQLRGQ